MTLHTVTDIPKGLTNWCGPSAVSIITGKTYADVLQFFKKRRSSHSSRPNLRIKGTSTWEVRNNLASLGFRTDPWPSAWEKGATLAKWIRSREKHMVTEMALVVAGHHWLVVEGRKAACGLTKAPVFTSDYPRRRKRVTEVYWVRPIAGWKPIPASAFQAPVKPKRDSQALREGRFLSKVRRLATKLDTTYKVDRSDSYFDMDPCGAFPEGFSTLHLSWEETWIRLERCLEDSSLVEDGVYSE